MRKFVLEILMPRGPQGENHPYQHIIVGESNPLFKLSVGSIFLSITLEREFQEYFSHLLSKTGTVSFLLVFSRPILSDFWY